nr:unnamed protein product [Callosobruchus analis]
MARKECTSISMDQERDKQSLKHQTYGLRPILQTPMKPELHWLKKHLISVERHKQKAKGKARTSIEDESGLIPLKFNETENTTQNQGRKHKKGEAKHVSNEGHQLSPANKSSSASLPKLHNNKKASKGKGKSKEPDTFKPSTPDPIRTQDDGKLSHNHKKQKHASRKSNISDTFLPPTQKHRGGSKRENPKRKHNSRHRSRRSVLEDFSDRERRDVTSDILWTHSETLDKGGLVVLKWQPRHQEILFRVEARTRGYVAIGFSPDGKMENADMVMGWVDDRRNQPFLLVSHFIYSH